MKKLLLSFLFFWLSFQLYATHNRAGEITYQWLGGTTYKAIITTYTKESVTADRCDLELFWGDGNSSILPRINGPTGGCGPDRRMGESLGNDIQKNIYEGTHTYATASGPEGYILHFEDPNRNAGVNNIVQSINVPFYVQTELFIAPSLGGNNSPQLLNPPIDDGCVNQVFEHNPGAFDIDGDSLSYRLVLCRTTDGREIPTIYDPQYVMDSLEIDPATGDMRWEVPRSAGQFNFAIQIEEFRKTANGGYFKIGYVTRDLQVDILSCNNQPPQIQPVGPFCVEAGTSLDFTVTATDPDNDPVSLTAFGGPFVTTSPAQFTGNNSTSPAPVPRVEAFRWNTVCAHVRSQPYYVTFEARDNPRNSNQIPLVDIYTTEITVVAPAPRNPQAVAQSSFIDLSWDQSICQQAIGYRLYRREDSFGFVPAECETGVPEYTGYKLIADIEGLANSTYQDSEDLKRGVRYCYMVIAYFEDGSESYASIEFCAALPLSLPLMTNADVLTTDASNGKIDVSWTPPPVIDSNNFPPPYGYVLYRATGLDGTDFQSLGTFNGLLDTNYTDSILNTRDTSYRYTVDFLFGPNQDTAGRADPGSSVYLEATGFDEGVLLDFTHNTPWLNFLYEIYREDSPGSGNFILIDSSNTDSYSDTGLVNGDTYCYKVQAYGRYTASNMLPMPLLNFSQEICAMPRDTNAPCAPQVTATYNCVEDSLLLEWRNPANPECKNDIAQYRIYYKPSPEDDFPEEPFLVLSASDTTYLITRSNDGPPITGCYAITAVDDADQDAGGTANESLFSEVTCAESCPLIEFPNVFTPNGDGSNDVFTAISSKDIRELRISIYNRWGTRVYQTNNAQEFLNNGWDGSDASTGGQCADGVYYYICKYTPFSIGEVREQQATGFVHLFRNSN